MAAFLAAGLAAVAVCVWLVLPGQLHGQTVQDGVGLPVARHEAGISTRAPGGNVLSRPMATLGLADHAPFSIGRAVFRRAWEQAPGPDPSAAGLGPLFNARACGQCHGADTHGHPPDGPPPGPASQSIVVRLSVPGATVADTPAPDPVYGSHLQHTAIPGHAAEGRLQTQWTETEVILRGGEIASLRAPTYRIVDTGYGPISDDIMLSVRMAPPMIGLGLLEAIPEDQILANADPEDVDGNGISGRSNRMDSLVLGPNALGRFGWKASVATLAEQNADAFSRDLGVSSRLAPSAWGDCTTAQGACRNAAYGAEDVTGAAEIDDRFMDFLLFYTRTVAVPARRAAEDPAVQSGGALFDTLGCTGCHQPSFTTAAIAAHPSLANQTIWPYSDLLLHDMGPGLADGRPDGLATGREWRTPPLWGIGLRQWAGGSAHFLHDGRARTLTEAVLWHGGEAEAARDAFAALPPEDRTAVIRFLEAL